MAIIAYGVYASGEWQKVRSLMIRSMIRIVRFSMVFAPLSHLFRYVARVIFVPLSHVCLSVVRVILVPIARNGVCLCFIAPFGWLSWLQGIGVCMPRSATHLAIGCQSIRAVNILAELSKVGFSTGWAFLRTYGTIFNTHA